MKTRVVFTAVAALLCVAASNLDEGVRWVFEDAPLGKTPEGWSVHQTGTASDSVWRVVEDATAPSGKQVLAQLAAYGPNDVFNLCVCDESNLKDLEVSVALKAKGGKLDQGGGLVWRYKNEKNYYLARLNPLEKNIRVYKVEQGKRMEFASVNTDAPAGKWHTIRDTHKGDNIRCYLNGKLHLDVKDGTFSDFGPVGLWTKADAVTSFDDFTYREI
jgi:hypothetical protein